MNAHCLLAQRCLLRRGRARKVDCDASLPGSLIRSVRQQSPLSIRQRNVGICREQSQAVSSPGRFVASLLTCPRGKFSRALLGPCPRGVQGFLHCPLSAFLAICLQAELLTEAGGGTS